MGLADKIKTADETKRARIDLRTHERVKETIERAAELSGKTLSEFITSAAEEAARAVLASHEQMKLGEAARKTFFAALAKPPAPSTRLRKAAERYKRTIGA